MADIDNLDYTSPGQIAKAQNQLRSEPEFVMTIECDKCGGWHEDLSFKKLKKDVESEGLTYTHAGECPETGMPIRLAWKNPNDVVASEKSAFTEGLSKLLKTGELSPEEITKILAATQEAKQDDNPI